MKINAKKYKELEVGHFFDLSLCRVSYHGRDSHKPLVLPLPIMLQLFRGFLRLLEVMNTS